MKAFEVVVGMLMALFFGALMVAFVLLFAVAMAVPWMLGFPVTIKEGGSKVGYLRWLTFHRSVR